jgi:cation diffusion facilitator CzcD-associated flavoprotein CzcO
MEAHIGVVVVGAGPAGLAAGWVGLLSNAAGSKSLLHVIPEDDQPACDYPLIQS